MTGSAHLDFLVEPFEEGNPGKHVRAAIDAARQAGLHVAMGPFGNTVEGDINELAKVVGPMLRSAVATGATRVSITVGHDEGQTGPTGSLHGALDRMIETVESELGGTLEGLPREQKQAAVRLLDERGAFLLRKSIEDVAATMGVSRITIYNYLNAIKSG